MTARLISTKAPPTNYPEYPNERSKNKFQYLFFDLSRGFLNALSTSSCDCASLAAKILVLALPILCFFEAVVDLLSMPFIWIANQLCRESSPPPINIPPPQIVPPVAPPAAIQRIEMQTTIELVPTEQNATPNPPSQLPPPETILESVVSNQTPNREIQNPTEPNPRDLPEIVLPAQVQEETLLTAAAPQKEELHVIQIVIQEEKTEDAAPRELIVPIPIVAQREDPAVPPQAAMPPQNAAAPPQREDAALPPVQLPIAPPPIEEPATVVVFARPEKAASQYFTDKIWTVADKSIRLKNFLVGKITGFAKGLGSYVRLRN